VSGRAMEWAHELAVDKRLAATVAHVLVRLAYHANSRTGRAWPAVDTLADECQLSGRAIQQALAVLERRPDPDTGEVAGYLEATRRHGYTTVWHFPQCPQTRPQPAPGGERGSLRGERGSPDARSRGERGSPDPGVSRREPGARTREAVDTWTDERGYVYVGRRPLALEDGRT
jgi:hypothetical protein